VAQIVGGDVEGILEIRNGTVAFAHDPRQFMALQKATKRLRTAQSARVAINSKVTAAKPHSLIARNRAATRSAINKAVCNVFAPAAARTARALASVIGSGSREAAGPRRIRLSQRTFAVIARSLR